MVVVSASNPHCHGSTFEHPYWLPSFFEYVRDLNISGEAGGSGEKAMDFFSPNFFQIAVLQGEFKSCV